MRIVLGILLCLVIGSSAFADEETINITPTVKKSFDEYLNKIKTTDSGAFAVSVDGTTSYFIYCEDSGSCGSVTTAMKKCRAMAGSECHLLAKGSDLQMKFEVAERSREPSTEELKGVLGTDGIRKLIVGNSQTGTYENNVGWAEYFAPDGTIRGHVDPDTEYDARYTIEDGKICYDYDGSARDWCAQISVSDGRMHHIYDDGKVEGDLEDTVVIKGDVFDNANPKEPVLLK